MTCSSDEYIHIVAYTEIIIVSSKNSYACSLLKIRISILYIYILPDAYCDRVYDSNSDFPDFYTSIIDFYAIHVYIIVIHNTACWLVCDTFIDLI